MCIVVDVSVTVCKQMYLSVCYSVHCGRTNVSVTLCIVVEQMHLSVCYRVYCSQTIVSITLHIVVEQMRLLQCVLY